MGKTNQPQTTGLQKFAFETESEIRVINIDGLPWFVAADICNALRLKNPTSSVSQLITCERSKFNLGRQGSVWIVSESGLYFLMLRCRDAVNEGTLPWRFRMWVTSEVLPAIRKTGSYSVQPQPSEKLHGQYVQVTGADDNLYLFSILKAIREFIGEEIRGNCSSECRMVKKIEAARLLFPEERDRLRCKI